MYGLLTTLNMPANGLDEPIVVLPLFVVSRVSLINCFAVAASAVGTSKMAGVAPIGSPSGSVRAVNFWMAVSRAEMLNALPAPVDTLARPDVKKALLFKNFAQKRLLTFN